MVSLDSLPEDCFSEILSLTSPRDACNASLVSSSVRSMADSDTVWEKFLPSDYKEIMSRISSSLINFSTKKELYFKLCEPQLLDGGRKMFGMEKSSGKKQFAIGARDLSIVWADNPLYWTWRKLQYPMQLQQPRFPEVVELRTICWLDIQARFPTKLLSPNTTYAAYLVLQLADRAYGLDILPAHVSIKVGSSVDVKGEVLLRRRVPKWDMVMGRMVSSSSEGGKMAVERGGGGGGDGWLEVEVGRFYNEGGNNGEEVEMCLKEVDGVHLKGGLIVESIEIRPIFG